MRKLFWILKTELKQSQKYFLFIFLISFILGSGLSLAQKAHQKISDLTAEDVWSADLAVLPKGISLIDFKKEIQQGQAVAFLPEVLFDTFTSMGKDRFQVTAFLPLTDNRGTRVLVKGDEATHVNTWLKSIQKFSTWETQQIYETPEWGRKVIAGFLISGPPAMMTNLKEMIDRKTVAQGILIHDQIAHDQTVRDQLEQALGLYAGILILLALFSLGLVFMWLKNRLAKSLFVFHEIGFSKSISGRLMIILFLFFVLSPVLIGFFLTAQTIHL